MNAQKTGAKRTLPGMIRLRGKRAAICSTAVVATALLGSSRLYAQDDSDGGVSHDRRGNILLESVYVPDLPGAPFSLVLSAEWTRPMMTGGSFTIVNSRPIKRDSAGRIYQERWLMVPKGGNTKSTISVVQISDPVARVYYECSPRKQVCELHAWNTPSLRIVDPSNFTSGKLSSGKGYRTHEDKGADVVGGVPVHAYRDTTVLDTGTLGNDSPMTYTRDVRFSRELGFNLTSILQSPLVGEQRFAVTEITRSEPEPHWFQPPEGFRIIDLRKEDTAQP